MGLEGSVDPDSLRDITFQAIDGLIGVRDVGADMLFSDSPILDVGRWTLDVGRRTSDAGRRTSDAGRRTPDVGRQPEPWQVDAI